jgi:CRISPR-associated endonuclease Csy4
MDYYLDLQISSNPDLASAHVMNALFSSLHNILGRSNTGNIGVSFPKADAVSPTMGNVMRLHGKQKALTALMATKWLRGLTDDVRATAIAAVPEKAQHCTVRRVQALNNSDIARLRRRACERDGLNEDAARERIPDNARERLNLPYMSVQSGSNKNSFRIFVEHGPTSDDPREGFFTSYGFGKGKDGPTVPWF